MTVNNNVSSSAWIIIRRVIVILQTETIEIMIGKDNWRELLRRLGK